MGNNVLYTRDLLYPTDTIYEPGSVHVEILNPTKQGKMPVVIESRTSHSPIDYIDSIISIMQSDIFDRIHINIKNNVSLYIKVGDNDELAQKYGSRKFIGLTFNDGSINYKGLDEIEE